MTDASLCLMAVHAHPDDECYSGGTFGRYASEGARTALVTCTLGEEGEIVDPTMDVAAVQPRLAEVRTEELRCSVEALGIGRLHLLGYRDSGMAGTRANAHPLAFTNTDFEAAVRRLVKIVRDERPQVMVTYDPQGGYGHPDHIMAHRIALAAFDAAGDTERYPEGGEMGAPWLPSKIYYIAWALESMLEMGRLLAERGLPNPFDGESGAAGASGGAGETPEGPAAMPSFIHPMSEITTTVDVAPYTDRVLASLRCHRTQIAPTGFPLGLPEDLAKMTFSRDTYILARSRARPVLPETDLFAGLR